MSKRMFRAALIASIIAGASFSTPVFAKGCNGVINILVWGCAPWDENNGPGYPYYKDRATKQISLPVTKDTKIRIINGQQQVLHEGRWLGLVSNSGGTLMARY